MSGNKLVLALVGGFVCELQSGRQEHFIKLPKSLVTSYECSIKSREWVGASIFGSKTRASFIKMLLLTAKTGIYKENKQETLLFDC